MRLRDFLKIAVFSSVIAPSVAVADEDDPRLEARKDYRVTAFAGVEAPLTGEGMIVPVVQVQGYAPLEGQPLDLLATANTSGIFLEGRSRGRFVDIGVQPFVRLVANGNHQDFDNGGNREEEKEVSSNEVGVKAFGELHLEDLTVALGYEFLGKQYGLPTWTSSAVPDSHLAFRAILDADYALLEEDAVLQRKEGFELELDVMYEGRGGFTSNVEGLHDNVHAFFFHTMAGGYLFVGERFNLQVQERFGLQRGTDIFNAWYQGGFVNNVGPLPGSSFKQFRHSTWTHMSGRVGAVVFDDYHIRAGVDTLILLGENKVEGAETSDLVILPSLSASLNARVAGLLPVGLHYAYAPTVATGDGDRGGHSLFAYVAVGAGRLE